MSEQRPSGTPSSGGHTGSESAKGEGHKGEQSGGRESSGNPGSDKAGGGSANDTDRKGDAAQKK